MFTYKGTRSNDMHLRVLNDIEFASPTRDVELVQVPGRDGDLVMDNGRFNSVVRSIPCRLEAPRGVDVETCINEINNWLIDDGRFHDFSWDNDPRFVYQARVEGEVVSHRMLSRFGKSVLKFRMHPIKLLKSSLTELPVTQGMNVSNPFSVDGNPRLVIRGSGNIVVNIDGRPLRLERIGGGCIVDSATQTITDLSGNITQFDRMFSPFPVLTPGDNQITFPNNVQVSITTRLGALV